MQCLEVAGEVGLFLILEASRRTRLVYPTAENVSPSFPVHGKPITDNKRQNKMPRTISFVRRI